jgi:hypothetical protein
MVPDNAARATEMATGFADYPRAPETAASEKNAPAASAKRPRPVLCIADGCLCSFASDEDLGVAIAREQLPIGCAYL